MLTPHRCGSQLPSFCLLSPPRKQAGHTLLLTSEKSNQKSLALQEFFTRDFHHGRIIRICLDTHFAGRSRLVQLRLLLTQHFFAFAAVAFLRCSTSHRTGRSSGPISFYLKLVFRGCLLQQTSGRTEHPFAVAAFDNAQMYMRCYRGFAECSRLILPVAAP